MRIYYRLLSLLGSGLTYAQNTTIGVISAEKTVPPILTLIRSFPYPLNIVYEQSGLIIPWVLCLIITSAVTICCCACGHVRNKNKKKITRIVVEPRQVDV